MQVRSMDMKVFSKDGKEIKTISLDDTVFSREVNESAIYHAIRNELANLRQGTASTKGRSDVAGSRRKLWRQKGTGRARMGTRQSPIWVGGGVAFGPKPRDYSYKIPRKLKRLAFKSVLSLKNKEGSLLVIEDFEVEEGKTRNLAAILKKLIPAERSVFIIKDDDKLLKRAGRNIPWLTTLSFDKLRVHDLFYGRKVLLFESAALKLSAFYGADKVAQKSPADDTPVKDEKK